VIQQFLFKRRDHDGFAQSQSPRHPARELLTSAMRLTSVLGQISLLVRVEPKAELHSAFKVANFHISSTCAAMIARSVAEGRREVCCSCLPQTRFECSPNDRPV
jgi:hypothetical protein